MSTKINPSCDPYCTIEIVSWDTPNSNQSDKSLTKKIGIKQPSTGECARFEKRPLSWAVWLPLLSANTTLDKVNLEFSHEHLVFEDTGDNIGFGPNGLFSEDIDQYEYQDKSKCFDAAIMRKAIVALENKFLSYNFFLNNCQDYAKALRDMYNELGGR